MHPIQRWTFVPTGIHLIDSVDVVKSALRTQNEYCHRVRSVTIEGIPELTMQTGGLNGEHMETSLKNPVRVCIASSAQINYIPEENGIHR